VLAVRVVEDHPDPEWLLDRLASELPRTIEVLRELGA
jgi:hypothetical protein